MEWQLHFVDRDAEAQESKAPLLETGAPGTGAGFSVRGPEASRSSSKAWIPNEAGRQGRSWAGRDTEGVERKRRFSGSLLPSPPPAHHTHPPCRPALGGALDSEPWRVPSYLYREPHVREGMVAAVHPLLHPSSRGPTQSPLLQEALPDFCPDQALPPSAHFIHLRGGGLIE